jgi:hypothetical protein
MSCLADRGPALVLVVILAFAFDHYDVKSGTSSYKSTPVLLRFNGP